MKVSNIHSNVVKLSYEYLFRSFYLLLDKMNKIWRSEFSQSL